jgi:hypothetical protein
VEWSNWHFPYPKVTDDIRLTVLLSFLIEGDQQTHGGEGMLNAHPSLWQHILPQASETCEEEQHLV